MTGENDTPPGIPGGAKERRRADRRGRGTCGGGRRLVSWRKDFGKSGPFRDNTADAPADGRELKKGRETRWALPAF